MTLLITGTTGLVGKALIKYLINETEYQKKPKTVRILVRKKKNSPDREAFIEWCIQIGIDIFYGDLTCEESVYAFTCVNDPEDTTLIHSEQCLISGNHTNCFMTSMCLELNEY